MKKIFKLVLICCLSIQVTNMAYADLSLNDLEFKKEDLKFDSKFSKTMEERQRKLQIHQKLGLATMAMMTATLIAADSAKDNDLHKYLGMTTGLMYWTTAYYSLSAPEVEGQKESGSSKIHKTLAWIHAPLMAIVPVLGYLNKQDHNKGKEPSGIVKAHGGLATVAYASFIAAGLSMYFDLSF